MELYTVACGFNHKQPRNGFKFIFLFKYLYSYNGILPIFPVGASLRDDLSKYFWFHHSQGDTMTVQDPNQMNLCAAVWTVVSYVIADMEEMLPR